MSAAPADIWYFSKGGKQYGPLTTEELRFLSSQGELDPRLDLVWSSGHGAWKPAGEIPGLFEKAAAPAAVPALADQPDIRIPARRETVAELMHAQQDWAGIGRAIWLIGSLVLVLGYQMTMIRIVPILAHQVKGQERLLMVIPLLFLVGIVILDLKRLQNTGMSRWWFFGRMVPFLNLWIFYRMFACPRGYAYHHRLDGFGVFLAIVYWLGVCAVFAAFAALVLVLMGKMGDASFHAKVMQVFHQLQAAAANAPHLHR